MCQKPEAWSFYPGESLNNALNKASQMYKHFCFLEQNNWNILYDASTRKKNKALIFVNAKSMQWECFVAKIAINPWVVFLSLQRRCTKQLLVFIRVHKSLANGIWWVWVILVIFFSDSGLQRLIKDKHCTANIWVVYCTVINYRHSIVTL